MDVSKTAIQSQIVPQAASPATQDTSRSTGSNHNVVGVHYKIGRKIGEGSFGIIYEGKRAKSLL
jgi:hypothetical protein